MTDLAQGDEYVSYLDRMERFIEILRSHGSHAEAYNVAEQLFRGSTDLVEDLDCAFRSHLRALLEEDLLDVANRTVVVQLLDYAIAFTLEYFVHHSSLVKIPYSMVDDILQSQTIQGAELIWPFIETSMESYASISTLFEAKHGNKFFLNRAQLNMLKACNSLLRRLSKSCNTEFCGRVLMFLAKVFDISEKSAANLVGRINFTNLTQFETEQIFLESNCPGSAPQQPVSSEDAMVVEGEDATSFRGAEESKGDGDTANGQVLETETATAALKGSVISLYEDYKTFWSLQTHFTSATADGKVVENITKWREFHLAALAVMKILSQHNYSMAEIRQAASTSHRDHTVDAYGYMGCKFLTSSQLFGLELRDPNLRQQVVTQVVYYLHHIAQKPTSFWESVEVAQEVRRDMLQVFQAAKEILQHTPGSDQLEQVLDRVLSREPHWVQWKFKDGCPPFEKKISTADKRGESHHVGLLLSHLDQKTVSNALHGGGSSGSGNTIGGKRRRPNSQPPSSSTSSLNEARKKNGALDTSEYEFDYDTVKEKARQLAEAMPTFENEIEKYFDAEDPDAGIEEEYHPKHDNTYCWKTRRLMAAKKLFVFSVMSDGNIAKALPLLRPAPPRPEATISPSELKDENGGQDGVEEKSGGDELVAGEERMDDSAAVDSAAIAAEESVAEKMGEEEPTETLSATTGEEVAHPNSSSEPLSTVGENSVVPPGDTVSEAIEVAEDSVSSSGGGEILPVADPDPKDIVSEKVAEADETANTMQ